MPPNPIVLTRAVALGAMDFVSSEMHPLVTIQVPSYVLVGRMIVVLCHQHFTKEYLVKIRRQIPLPITIKDTEDPLQMYMATPETYFGFIYGESNTQANHEVRFKAFHEKNSPFSISLTELKPFFEDLLKPRSPSLEQIVLSELDDL
jgi:hypothetical protein